MARREIITIGHPTLRQKAHKVARLINSLGTNLLFVAPGSTSSSGVNSAQGSAQTLTYEDAQALADSEDLSSVSAVAAQVGAFGQVVYQSNNVNTQVLGVTANYGTVRNYTVETGEFITDNNVTAKSSVVVLGANVASELFTDGQDPVGQSIDPDPHGKYRGCRWPTLQRQCHQWRYAEAYSGRTPLPHRPG